MHSLFNRTDVGLILERVNRLTPSSVRSWGKMTVSQMLAHCSVALEFACGKKPGRRSVFSYLLGHRFKRRFLSEQALPMHVPTGKDFLIKNDPDFDHEKTRLSALIRQFADGGRDKCTEYPHTFFGKMAPEEWSIFMYKHLDHHLRQFGV
jgi:hypothetical protein